MLTNDWTLDEVGLNELKTTTMILEGDYTSQDVPHFTGLCDVKAPILRNVGRNLFDSSDSTMKSSWWIITEGGSTNVKKEELPTNYSVIIPAKGGTQYRVSGNNITRDYYAFLDKHYNKLHANVMIDRTTKATSPQGTAYALFYLNHEDIEKVTNLQIEEGSTLTTYEDYKTNILETSNDLVLRGLPSGIRDTYDCLTGEYIRRVGERDYQESDESDSNVITDLVKTHYELAEPIVTQIEPSTTPFAYENGHIILESGHEGQSLLPMLEYSTVINKTGLVENVAKTIQRQEKQLTMLEKMLIQNIINLDYNNTLLTLKNEMELRMWQKLFKDKKNN